MKGRQTMEAIISSWRRIEQWLATHAPEMVGKLHAGASEEDFAEAAKAEARLGFAFPEAFKASYRLHNGWSALMQTSMANGHTLREIVEEWVRLVPLQNTEKYPSKGTIDYDPKIRLMRWHARWIPFAENPGELSLCLDLAPAEGGQVGQVIEFDHSVGGPTHVVASSFGALFSQLADELEAGQYIVENTYLIDTSDMWRG